MFQILLLLVFLVFICVYKPAQPGCLFEYGWVRTQVLLFSISISVSFVYLMLFLICAFYPLRKLISSLAYCSMRCRLISLVFSACCCCCVRSNNGTSTDWASCPPVNCAPLIPLALPSPCSLLASFAFSFSSIAIFVLSLVFSSAVELVFCLSLMSYE